MPTATSNFGLPKPLVNNATDQDLWGGYLNTALDDIDGLIFNALNMTAVAHTSSFAMAAATPGTATTGSANNFFSCDATSGNITASLPAAASAGAGFFVALKKIDASVNTVIITPNGTDKIDGNATFTLAAQYAWCILVCDGTNWNILSDVVSIAGLASLGATQSFTGVNTFTQSPVIPDVANTDNSTNAINSHFVNNGGQSLGTQNGYFMIGKYMVQFIAGNFGFNAAVNFPTSFPNAVLGICGVHTDTQNSSGWTPGVNYNNNSQFHTNCANLGSSTFTVIAVGY